jgi:hypothetical protein
MIFRWIAGRSRKGAENIGVVWKAGQVSIYHDEMPIINLPSWRIGRAFQISNVTACNFSDTKNRSLWIVADQLFGYFREFRVFAPISQNAHTHNFRVAHGR